MITYFYKVSNSEIIYFVKSKLDLKNMLSNLNMITQPIKKIKRGIVIYSTF